MDQRSMKLRLEGYANMLKELRMQLARLERKVATLGEIGGLDYSRGMVAAPPGDPVANEIQAIEHLREAVAEIAVREEAEHAALERIIARVANAEQRTVIRMRYFDGMDWTEIAECFYGDRPNFAQYRSDYIGILQRLHTRAVAAMAAAARKTA